MRPLLLAILCCLVSSATVVADTYCYYYYSLEWLVDASDSIVEATVVPNRYTGNPTGSKIRVKSIAKVLKQVGKEGPVEGDELACHVAGGSGHRVLLFTRPGRIQPAKRVAYCVYLTADNSPESKKEDAFFRLPCHSSAFMPLEFNYAACVASDRNGRMLTDPVAVVRFVEDRVKADPTHVSAEGYHVEPRPAESDVHFLLVPPEAKTR